jgi:uncharacterized membrane protein YbhN (UPF0104 family)
MIGMIRRCWSPWLRLLFGVAILAALAWRLGIGPFAHGLRLVANPQAVLMALLIGLLTTLLSAARWCLVARRIGLTLPLAMAVLDYYSAIFLNTVLPGGVLGDVDRAVRHGRNNGDVGRGVRAVVIERTANQIVVLTTGVVVLLAKPQLLAAVARGAVSASVVIALSVLVGAVLLIALVRRSRRWRTAIANFVTEARLGLLSRDTWPAVVLLSIAALAGHLVLFLIAARLAGTTAAASQLLPLLVLALLAMGLPVNVGGWGPREGMAALAFGVAGLGAAQGLTTAVLYGGLTFVSALPGAGALVLRRVVRPHRVQVDLEKRVLAQSDSTHRRA